MKKATHRSLLKPYLHTYRKKIQTTVERGPVSTALRRSYSLAKRSWKAKRGDDFLIADFTDTWEDRLPEAWRKDAQLTSIEGVYEFPSETTIRAKGKAAATANGDHAAVSMKPSARKWHEKFGKTRKK